jgi:beta-N-acetylhexosaminidase
LCVTLRDSVGRNAPIFIDQEGGRVQRLRPPHWRNAPPAGVFGLLYEQDAEAAKEAVWINHRQLAAELAASGIDADCAPCLDLAIRGADAVIGDRAYGEDPSMIAALGRAAMDGLMAGGVAPVIKHIPGHGRADADSHFHLPRVREPIETLTRTDFAPFAALKDAPMAMTAHIVYDALDPGGLLMTDDLSMKALSGSFEERTRRSLQSGCDVVLHCNGDRGEMDAIAEAAPLLSDTALDRACAAESSREQAEPYDVSKGQARLERLLSRLAA